MEARYCALALKATTNRNASAKRMRSDNLDRLMLTPPLDLVFCDVAPNPLVNRLSNYLPGVYECAFRLSSIKFSPADGFHAKKRYWSSPHLLAISSLEFHGFTTRGGDCAMRHRLGQ